MKPMAQSTPTTRPTTPKEIATSPVARPRASSISDNKRINLNSTNVRRNSVSELKNTPHTLKRTLSSGSSGINSVLGQIRQNLSKNIKEITSDITNKKSENTVGSKSTRFVSNFNVNLTLFAKIFVSYFTGIQF